MSVESVAQKILETKRNIVLIYAFNGVGKTRVSVAYKKATKGEDLQNAGVYYNAFSEDLFIWNNDTENREEDIRLTVRSSKLNGFHGSLTEDSVKEVMRRYNPKFDFRFSFYPNSELGIESIRFFPSCAPDSVDETRPIKISRGEERTFVWCFFLALFRVQGLADTQSGHFFIDDPVSSLDDNNVFATASALMDLIEEDYKTRRFIITTHHAGFLSILWNWLKKGEKAGKFKDHVKTFVLREVDGDLALSEPDREVMLYHLHLLQVLTDAIQGGIEVFHFALLRQALENVASFLGVGQAGYVLEQIGYEKKERVQDIINSLCHKNVYRHDSAILSPTNEALLREIIEKLMNKYQFVLHRSSQEGSEL